MTKSAAPKVAARKARSVNFKTTFKGTGRARDKHHKTVPTEKVHKKLAERVRGNPTGAQYEQLRGTQVPDTLRALAEKNLAQTREQYERSKNTLKAVLESWQKSFGAAGEGAVALNRKIIDITERNIDTGFDLATGLVGAKNLAEVMELQAAYWRKLLGALQTDSSRRMKGSIIENSRSQAKSVAPIGGKFRRA
jgi:hypothetical protein